MCQAAGGGDFALVPAEEMHAFLVSNPQIVSQAVHDERNEALRHVVVQTQLAKARPQVVKAGEMYCGLLVLGRSLAAQRDWYLLPNNQRQHRTSHAPKDVLPLRDQR